MKNPIEMAETHGEVADNPYGMAKIKKMAKCLDGDFKTFKELETKIDECLGKAYLHILNCKLIVLLFYFDTRVSPIKLFKL